MAEVQKVGREYNLVVSIERYDVVDGSSSASNSAVNQAVNVLKARISLSSSGQHVEYTLRVLHQTEAWTLRKRFSEVAALHDALKKRLSSMPDMPAKSAVRQFSPEYLEARRVALNEYLQAITKRRDVLNCVEAQQFFGLPERVRAFQQPHASEPVQAAEVHEAHFGIGSFAYDPVQGLLLIGATERSWASRMDTKITNIKLPWEPAAPNLPSSQMSLWRQSPADLRFEMQFTVRFTASISCVVILVGAREKGWCLCGLSDGTVGCHALNGEPGITNSGGTLPLLRHTAAVAALVVDDSEQWVISASKDNAIMVYDARRQMLQCEVQTVAPTSVMLHCQKQRRLFCGLQTGRVLVWDTSILPIQQLATIPDGTVDPIANTKISGMDYDAASSTLFTACASGFGLWAVKSSNTGVWGRKAGQIAGITGKPTAIVWANSSRELLVGFASGAVVIFDVDTGVASYAMQAHKDEITAMVWLDAPRRLLTASADRTLKIWDFPSLHRTTLEDQLAHITPPSVSVSMAPHMALPGSRSSFGARVARTTEPLLGRPAAQSAPCAAGPLPGGPASPSARASGGPGGAAAGAAIPAGDAGRGAGAPRPGAAAPSAGQQQQAGAARPGATAPARDDSDDDLRGWDS